MEWMTSTNNNPSNYTTKTDISYLLSKSDDDYKNERCRLDIYYPTNKKDFKTVVWFHGGGLEVGEKFIPSELKDKGLCVVAVNYRLSPKVHSPLYIEDGAEAIAWVFKNIENFGGDNNKIFISGHSAGGYLTLMLGLDKKYLMHFGIDANQIAGLIPLSGQTNTHYTIRKERNLNTLIPLVDQMAPLNCAREDIPPILLITGDKNKEMLARYEENAHLAVILKALGNKDVTLYELSGFDHGTMLSPSLILLNEWINKH
ncbi:MAG: alpha/beta hydrolase [Bacteroidales bacterium]|nr:alpha/beta hydrolase [Bacteroidales bacterium]